MRSGYLVLEAKRALRNPRFLVFTIASVTTCDCQSAWLE